MLMVLGAFLSSAGAPPFLAGAPLASFLGSAFPAGFPPAAAYD